MEVIVAGRAGESYSHVEQSNHNNHHDCCCRRRRRLNIVTISYSFVFAADVGVVVVALARRPPASLSLALSALFCFLTNGQGTA